MKKFTITLLVLITLFLTACGDTEYEAKAVDEDTDVCDVCNMTVPNNQHATQIALEDGRSLMFDDLGCLIKWKNDNDPGRIGKVFVRDYYSEEWFGLNEATFVYDKNIMTPMAYNIISFQDREDANEFIESEGMGVIIESEGIMNHHWERNMEMMQKMKEEMGHGHK